MFLLFEYETFWIFLLISSLMPILAFLISRALAPISEGPEKLTSYESGIEAMGDAWIQFRIRYYMFAPWAMSFDILGISTFIEASIFVLILIVGSVHAWRRGALEWS
uniref:NAD(P)H-quinone oxidoreductase subunit 3 n=2 Tax=Cycas TaxID=3395 RepID=L7NP17_CYCRE|nr:NADH dehydrogenase subunit 3 [Cycas revoluta]YP_009308222.1 NADH dehydrogenase subunit 3 [Cycas panzhihuaensis]AEX99201.1 NADH dehydrogenase subunit 3 [Cycas revoluta]AOS53171.1 NADH dehydrogenase subunit 3 [Cycas panzhihuaensis]